MKSYTFEVFETKRFIIEVEAENGEKAQEEVNDKLRRIVKEKYIIEGVREDFSERTMSLLNAVEIDN